MNTKSFQTTILAAAATAAASNSLTAAESGAIADLVNRIKSKDDKVRGEAWQKAGPAVPPP